MLRKRSKKDYLVPRSAVTEVDLEGLVCASGFKRIQVDELHNMNVGDDASGTNSEHYFEF